jgi:hypothetical protein
MLRVSLGRARPETEWNVKISGLEISSNPGGRTGAQAFGTNNNVTVPQSHLEHEIDVEGRGDISAEDSGCGKEN